MKLLSSFKYDVKRNRLLLLMILPTVFYFFLFYYIPMPGIVIAFKRLDYSLGVFRSPWVGFENFKYFFLSGQALIVTKNTVFYNTAFIIVGTILQISLAVFLSELGNKTFKKVFHGMMFFPYFVSWVVVAGIAYNVFSYDFGVFNNFLSNIGREKIDIYGTPSLWKYILTFFNSWKHAGYGSVVYLAAIMSIDTEMYEAASIDGANIFQKLFKITIPCLVPQIVILTLLSIGNIFRGDFGMFWQLVGKNGLLFNSTDVIDTFVFRSLMFSSEFGMAAAAGLFQSVLCLIILSVTNYAVRRVQPDYALF